MRQNGIYIYALYVKHFKNYFYSSRNVFSNEKKKTLDVTSSFFFAYMFYCHIFLICFKHLLLWLCNH